jgi:hypothetical protein
MPASRILHRARRLLIWAAPFLIALVGYLYADRQLHPPFTGDEPHYALEAFSLADDGDFDLTNDYASVDRVFRVTGTPTLQPQAVQARPGGPLVSIHGAGLAIVLAPAARLGGSVAALRIEMIVLAAIGAQLLFSIMAKVAPRLRWLLWAAWAAVTFSLPLVGYATRLYPEMPASVLVLLAVRLLMARRLNWRHVLGVALAVGALPWLHVRFGIVGAGLAIALIVRLHQSRRGRWPVLGAAFLLPLVVSVALLSITAHTWYGTWSPVAQLSSTNHILVAPAAEEETSALAQDAPAPAEPAVAPAPPDSPRFSVSGAIHADRVISGGLREMLSSRNGLLPFVPVGILALAGLLALAISGRRWLAYGGFIALVYIAQVASTGVLPGFALPGRFEVVVLPLIGVPLVLTLSAVRWSRYLFWPLAAAGAAITVYGVTHAPGLVMTTPGQARVELGPLNPLMRVWPVISREPNQPAPRYPVALCRGRGPVGRCQDGEVVSRGSRRGVLLTAGRTLPAGDYTVIIDLERKGAAPSALLAARLTLSTGDTQFLVRTIPAGEIPEGLARSFTQDIRLTGSTALRTRVVTTGATALMISGLTYNVSADPMTGLGAVGPRHPDIGWALAWVLVMVALATALAVSLRRPSSGSADRADDVGPRNAGHDPDPLTRREIQRRDGEIV